MKLIDSQNEFLKWMEARGYSPGTVRLRRACLRDFVAFLKDRSVEDVEEVTRDMVEEYRAWMMNRDHIYTGKKLSPMSVAHHLEAVRIFFGFLTQRKVLMIDPSAALTWPRRRYRPPKNIPTEKEMEMILFRPDIGTLTGLRDRAILELIYSTGIRREEASKLNVYDLNAAEGTVTVRSGKGGKGRK